VLTARAYNGHFSRAPSVCEQIGVHLGAGIGGTLGIGASHRIEMNARTKYFTRHTRFLIVDEPSGSQHERIVNWDVAGERLSTPSKRFAKCCTS
jgi:hypothetical protein